MTNQLNRLILFSLAGMLFIWGEACSCSSSSSSTGSDGGIPDGGGGFNPDAIHDDQFHITGDTKVLPTPTKEHVVFATGEDELTNTKYSMARVNTDTTDYTLLPGIPQHIMFSSGLSLTGPMGSMDVMRHLPTSLRWANIDAIGLPNDLGKIFYWSVVETNGTTEYLFLARPTGEIYILDSCKSANCFGGKIAVSSDGKVAAAAKGDNSPSKLKMILYRLDGTNWPTGNNIAFDASSTEWGGDVQYQSLTIGAKHVLFTAEETPSPNYKLLFSAPLDGSAKATRVKLPNIGTQEAKYIKWYMAVSDDGKTFAFIVSPRSSSDGKEEVVTYRDGDTPSITNISNSPETYSDRYGRVTPMLDPRLAVSPTGKNVAFTTSLTGKAYIAGADGSNKKEIHTNFDSAVKEFGRFYWTSDDDLLFWAGASEETLDLYRYQVSTATLTPITKTGSTAAPYKAGALAMYGMWVSPNKNFIYFVMANSGTNVVGVNTKTFALVDITTGLDIRHEVQTQIKQDFESLPNNAKVWFIAKTTDSSNYNLYVFDQNAGSKAEAIAQNISTSDEIHKLTLSPSGAHVGYTTGKSAGTTRTEVLHVIPAEGGQPQDLLKDLYFGETYAWTPDGSAIVIGAGEKGGRHNLYKVPVTGEKTVLYQESPGPVEVIGVFKGTGEK